MHCSPSSFYAVGDCFMGQWERRETPRPSSASLILDFMAQGPDMCLWPTSNWTSTTVVFDYSGRSARQMTRFIVLSPVRTGLTSLSRYTNSAQLNDEYSVIAATITFGITYVPF